MTKTLRALLTEDADALGFNHGGLLTWKGDEEGRPTGGDSTWFGYDGLKSDTLSYQRHETDSRWLAHLSEATHMVVYGTTWGDYCGDDVQRSNYRSLPLTFGDSTFIDLSLGGFGAYCLALDLDQEHEEDQLEYLANELCEIADHYPLHDDQDHSELMDEVMHEDWGSWAEDDARREYRDFLEANGVTEDEAEIMSDNAPLTMWLEAWIGNGFVTYEMETAVSGHFHDLTRMLEGAAVTDAGEIVTGEYAHGVRRTAEAV